MGSGRGNRTGFAVGIDHRGIEGLEHPDRHGTAHGDINAASKVSGPARLHSDGIAIAVALLSTHHELALGIDGAAHEGALDALQDQGLATIAFVGTGIDRVYPKAHHTLARRIASQGLLISECPLGTPPLAANFPKRNRLIAAVSSGTLVVEAAMQSGSLITARLAADMGREVFAIPGSIHAPQARGCHALIRQGAKLVEAAQDVLEELHIQPVHERRLTPITHPEDSESPIDTELLRALGFDPVSLDALQARTGQPTALLQAELMTLELDGEVTRLPGGLYQRLARA